MEKPDTELLKKIIRKAWSHAPGAKAQSYVGQFLDRSFTANKISARVEGNYGTYRVSITVDNASAKSACSCYIGKHGYCHHCHALAITFLNDSESFQFIEPPKPKEIKGLEGVHAYLMAKTLETLLKELKENGVSQKDFAESIGMSSRHLTSIKSCELKNRYYNELGATKLACLWVLEHCIQPQKRKENVKAKVLDKQRSKGSKKKM
jgi:hypothetical protein